MRRASRRFCSLNLCLKYRSSRRLSVWLLHTHCKANIWPFSRRIMNSLKRRVPLRSETYQVRERDDLRAAETASFSFLFLQSLSPWHWVVRVSKFILRGPRRHGFRFKEEVSLWPRVLETLCPPPLPSARNICWSGARMTFFNRGGFGGTERALCARKWLEKRCINHAVVVVHSCLT